MFYIFSTASKHKGDDRSASGGSINNKNFVEAYELINMMANNNYSDRCASKKAADIFAVVQNTVLVAQMSSIQQQ